MSMGQAKTALGLNNYPDGVYNVLRTGMCAGFGLLDVRLKRSPGINAWQRDVLAPIKAHPSLNPIRINWALLGTEPWMFSAKTS